MDENYMYREDNENIENDLIYNSNEVSNYEEQACCSNFLTSTFGNNNIFSKINDICFKDIPINDEEIINNLNINQEIKTPLGSKKKKLTPDEYKINDNRNNNINQNNQNIFRNSLASNNPPSNDSAAEPILPIRRNNSTIIQEDNNGINGKKNKTNFFSNLANIFKDLFSDKKENIADDSSDKQSSNSIDKLSFKNRPVLKRIMYVDESNKNKINKNKINNKKLYIYKEPKMRCDDILALKISENNQENLTKLVSAIPAFIVKEKNMSKENNNKYCTICLGEFRIGQKESSLPCLHCFHSNCIEKWLKRSKFCPVCKLQISWESLNPKF